jgi:hypothetical protein
LLLEENLDHSRLISENAITKRSFVKLPEMGMNSYEDWVELYKISFELQLENITDQAMIEILESQK